MCLPFYTAVAWPYTKYRTRYIEDTRRLELCEQRPNPHSHWYHEPNIPNNPTSEYDGPVAVPEGMGRTMGAGKPIWLIRLEHSFN